MNGYYGPTNLGHIGVGYYGRHTNKLKGSPQRRRDDSEPFFMVGSSRGQDSRFSSLPHGFESRTDYKKVKPGEVVKVGLKQNYT